MSSSLLLYGSSFPFSSFLRLRPHYPISVPLHPFPTDTPTILLHLLFFSSLSVFLLESLTSAPLIYSLTAFPSPFSSYFYLCLLFTAISYVILLLYLPSFLSSSLSLPSFSYTIVLYPLPISTLHIFLFSSSCSSHSYLILFT